MDHNSYSIPSGNRSFACVCSCEKSVVQNVNGKMQVGQIYTE